MFKLYVSVHLQQSIIEFFAVSVYRPMGFKEREITSTFHTIIGKIIWKVTFFWVDNWSRFVYCYTDHLSEVKYAVEDSLKWDLPQHFKTRTQKSDYSHLRVKRSSLTLFAIEEFTAFISEQVDSLPGLEIAKRRTYRGEDLDYPEAVKVTKPRIREAKAPRTPSPKYFCQNCKADLCRDCFKVNAEALFPALLYHLITTQTACFSHNVQWMGNKSFQCTISIHCIR